MTKELKFKENIKELIGRTVNKKSFLFGKNMRKNMESGQETEKSLDDTNIN